MLRALAAAMTALACAAVALPAAADAPSVAAVAKNYADIAEAGYTDSLDGARKLKAAIDTLIKAPTQDNLVAARKAWIAARVLVHADGGIPLRQQDRRRLGGPRELLAAR